MRGFIVIHSCQPSLHVLSQFCCFSEHAENTTPLTVDERSNASIVTPGRDSQEGGHTRFTKYGQRIFSGNGVDHFRKGFRFEKFQNNPMKIIVWRAKRIAAPAASPQFEQQGGHANPQSTL
jgi:hypothetical protein